MSNYNDNWKAFVDETKEMSDEQLQEYVGDILNFARGLSSQSGEGGKKSHLSGLGSAANVAASDKRKKDAAAKKAAQLRAIVSKLLNATSLKDYVREYNKLVDADARNIRKIDSKVIKLIRDIHGYFEVDKLVKVLQSNSFSTFGNPKTLEKFIQLATLNRAQRRAAARGEKGSSKDSAKTPEAIANKRTAAKKKRKAQKQARKKGRPKRKEHIEIDQENTELISESVFKQWQKLIGTI